MQEEIFNLENILENSGKRYDIAKVEAAFLYAKELHEGQFRNSGEAYISHPVAVAVIAAELGLDTDSICAALLHDTVEDCSERVDLDEIRRRFGEDVAVLVDGLTKLMHIPFDDREERQTQDLRKMFLAMSRDVRVIFIKLCDRLHNMRTLDAKPPEKQRLTARETMHVFVPLAYRLGMHRIKTELETLALHHLDPVGCAKVENEIARRFGENRDFLDQVREQIASRLTAEGYHFEIEGRIKSVASMYHKMYELNKSFDQIFDYYALRVILEDSPGGDTAQCYAVMGIIHDMYSVVAGRFKDYISTPKSNDYRSLHTTVMGEGGIPFEVQIRTQEMHRIAEYGVAAHWKYKSGDSDSDDISAKLAWIAKLTETEEDPTESDDLISRLRIDFYQDEIFVFSPKGKLFRMPQGATPIDFAYTIHSEIGNQMVGAKVRGVIVNFDYVLQNGDSVEILTSPSSGGPKRDWLKIVKTTEARNKIRGWFKREKRGENIAIGTDLFNAELKKCGKAPTDQQRADIASAVAFRLHFDNVEDMLNALGYGGVTVGRVSAKIRDEYDKQVVPPPVITTADQVKTTAAPVSKKGTSPVIVDGLDGCEIKFAHCCSPLPGDDLIAFVTIGHGVTIHKRGCPNMTRCLFDPNSASRIVSAEWADAAEKTGTFPLLLRIYVRDRDNLLMDITSALSDMHVPINDINTKNTTNGQKLINLTVSCRNVGHEKVISDRLARIPSVENIVRGYA